MDGHALSATMYRMLSGKTPEPSIDRMLEDKVESLYEISQKNMGIKVSEYVSDIIQKGMSVKIENRWQRVDELAENLFGLQIKHSADNEEDKPVNVTAAESDGGGNNAIIIIGVAIVIFALLFAMVSLW